ncbi:MAG: hypothetical protein U0T36_13175 [Saprospiraceae bacterium]
MTSKRVRSAQLNICVANSMKVSGGIAKGLKDPELFGRKVEMELYCQSLLR